MGIYFNRNNVLHELEVKDADGNPVPLEDDENNEGTQPEETPPAEDPEDDNTETQTENEPTDDGEDEGDQAPEGDGTPTEEPANDEGPGPDDSSASEEGDSGEAEDYSAGAPSIDDGEDEGEDGSQNQEGSQNSDNGDAQQDQDAPNPDTLSADLMDMENKLLTELSPEQLQIKHRELKKRYDEIYSMIDPIINRINNLSKDNTTLKIYDFITKKLNELRDLVSHYLIRVYPTKTYVENLINYEEYIAILHQIDRVLEQIPTQNDQNNA